MRFIVYILSGVVFIPFLVEHYGTGTYGLIALAGFLTQYVGMVSSAVAAAVSRFINIAINRNDWKQANEIFSTAVLANIVAIALQLPFYAVGLWKLAWLIDFPPERAGDFRLLVLCNITVFFNSVLTGVFFTPIAAANRLDIGQKLDIASLLIRLVLLYVLISSLGAKLWIIGVVDLGRALLTTGIGLSISRRFVDGKLRFSRKKINMKWVRPVLSMAGWSLVSALGFALFTRTDVWMLNRFVSKEMAGVYAALLVWPNLLKQVCGQFSSLLSPVYMIDFAKGNLERVGNTCLSSSKIVGLFSGFAVGFIYVFAEPILGQWIGEGFIQYAFLLKLMVVGLVVTLGESVIWGVFPALDKTHFSGLANLVTGILNILLSLGLVAAGYGVVGVALGTLVSTMVKCALVMPYGAARELGLPYVRFLANHAAGAVVFGLIAVSDHFFVLGVSTAILHRLAVYFVVSVVLTLFLFAYVLSGMERKHLLSWLDPAVAARIESCIGAMRLGRFS